METKKLSPDDHADVEEFFKKVKEKFCKEDLVQFVSEVLRFNEATYEAMDILDKMCKEEKELQRSIVTTVLLNMLVLMKHNRKFFRYLLVLTREYGNFQATHCEN